MPYWEAYMNKIKAWLDKIGWQEYKIEVASADASFRQYYRIFKEGKTFILMDSSLEKESLPPFIDVTYRLLGAGVRAPAILEENLDDGFLIIEDFGNTHYLNLLNEGNYKDLYRKAMQEIIRMQDADASGLPLYDKAFLHVEMDLMQEWFLQKYLGLELTDQEREMIGHVLDMISDVVLSQPQGVFVHRDYHSRNILLTPDDEVGVIDYQDAMNGSITYDLVSLLKDCYIAFEPKEVEKMVLMFRDLKKPDVSDTTFIRWFDFMGLQRHIKVLGIFSRLYLRDGKDGYLKDLPLTLSYAVQAAEKYDETKALAKLLGRVRLP